MRSLVASCLVRSKDLNDALETMSSAESKDLGAAIDKLGKTETAADLKTLFEKIDTDKSGTIEVAELQKALEEIGLKKSEEEIKKVFEEATAGSDAKSVRSRGAAIPPLLDPPPPSAAPSPRGLHASRVLMLSLHCDWQHR